MSHTAFTLTVAGSAPGSTHFRGHVRVRSRYGLVIRTHPSDGVVDRLQSLGFPPLCYPSYEAPDSCLGRSSLLNVSTFLDAQPCGPISGTRLTSDPSGGRIAPGDAEPTTPNLALTPSRLGSSRASAGGHTPLRSLGPVLPAIPSRLPAPSARSPQGPFPPAALFVTAFVSPDRSEVFSTTIPSDSRCTVLDFAIGLYEPLRPDSGSADGPLVFRTPPDTRAAPSTPPEPTSSFGTPKVVMAFAVT